MNATTPTPWFAVNRGSDEEPMWSVMAARIAGKEPGHEVAICATGDSPQEMETANAAFIVRAVNSHDELVAALLAAEAAILNCHEYRSHHHHQELEKVRAALSKAAA